MGRISGHSLRRLVAVGALVLGSAVCALLVALRVDPAWEYNTEYLLWNLWLAWIPFVLALVLYDGYRRGRSTWFVAGLGLLWLLFLPNAPYIVTDFVHLRDPGAEVLWFDAITIGAFALVGLVLGLGSLVLVQTVVADAYGSSAGWVVGVAALALSSVGIYLGRFVGVNSWDAVVDPARVLEPIADQLRESVVHPKFFGVTVVMTVCLIGAYVLVYVVAQPALALDPRRVTRR